MASSAQAQESVDLRDYVDVLSRRKWLILLVTVAFTGLAALYSFRSAPVYTGFTEILLQPQTDSSGLRPDQLVSLETEARVVSSEPVALIAQEELDLPITLTALLDRVSVKTTLDTLVLDISFTAPDAQAAAQGADAFAKAYLQFKINNAEDIAKAQREGLSVQQNGYLRQKEELERELERLDPGSAQAESTQTELDVVNGLIAAGAIALNEIPAVPPAAGTIIVPATPPKKPSSPNHPVNLAMGVMLGLVFGVVAAFARDRLDDRVAARIDLESLDLTVVATIPRTAHVGGDVGRLVTEHQPRSPAAEAYRSLRTSILAMARQSGDHVFAITSPILGEGKSTTTANLASALSHADKQVLVISADLRRPSLHRFFGLSNDVGLTQVLSGEVTLGEAIHRVSPSLSVLSSGPLVARPAELLQSNSMRSLIQRERERYDFIIIDCAPVLGITDTATVAPFVDTVILVARADKTKRGSIIEAMDQLSQVGASSQVAVINDISINRNNQTYGYGAESSSGRRRGSKRSQGSEPLRSAPPVVYDVDGDHDIEDAERDQPPGR